MKNFFATALLFLATVSISQAQQSVNMAIIQHNIHSGGRAQESADHIIDLMELTPQKAVIHSNEANYARQYFNFSYAGWHSFWKASPFEGRGNPIFVRDAAATILSSWVMEMQENWEHNKPRDPRVYSVVRCQLVNNPWIQFHSINVHFPTIRTGNGPARQESVDKLIAFSQLYPDIPLIICGDFNMSESEARQRIATPIGGRLFSNASVDHIIIRDGTTVGFGDTVSISRLGQMGSDHQVLRNTVTFVQKTSNIADWQLY